MKVRALILCCCTLVLLLTASASPAFADTPGACANKPTDCDQTCSPPAPGRNCVILIQRDGQGGVTMQLNGQPSKIFCVTKGTWVQWEVVDANATSFVDVRFDQRIFPFAQSSLQADSVNSVAAQVTGSGPCYSFAISDCPASANNGSCGYADPKVVVTPPGFAHRRGSAIQHQATPKPQSQQ